MRVSAVVVTGDRSPSQARGLGFAYRQLSERQACSTACIDILGQSVLDRTVARLRDDGLQAISVIGGPGCTSSRWGSDVEIKTTTALKDRWQLAERALKKHAGQGIETVLVIALGAHVDFALVDAIRFHHAKGQPVTAFHDEDGPLGVWIVDAAWARSTQECIFPFSENRALDSSEPFLVHGYVNRLEGASDLRRLVVDAFLSRCSVKPLGRETKPGVWIDDYAQVHRSARLVAPVYLGNSARVRRGAVIARFSNLERHGHVGEGSVVTSASVLPHTVIGAGLDVSDAVVNGDAYEDLGRNVTLKISDRNLIRDATPLRWRVPRRFSEPDELFVRRPQKFEIDCSQYLSRAAGRFFGVFKGEA